MRGIVRDVRDRRSVDTMAEQPWQRREIGELRRRAGEERRRAGRAAELAIEFAARADDCSERLRPAYLRLAELHRRMNERQLTAARLHETYADRLELHASGSGPVLPPFMAAVVQTLGVSGAAAALYSRRSRIPVLVATSDPTAEAAYNLEVSAGEGPAITTATEGRPVRAAGTELPHRWPTYGPAANRLGIRSVTAVPLQLPADRLGALCCYGGKSAGDSVVADVDAVAGALAPILLRTARGKSLHDLMEAPRSVQDNDCINDDGWDLWAAT